MYRMMSLPLPLRERACSLPQGISAEPAIRARLFLSGKKNGAPTKRTVKP